MQATITLWKLTTICPIEDFLTVGDDAHGLARIVEALAAVLHKGILGALNKS